MKKSAILLIIISACLSYNSPDSKIENVTDIFESLSKQKNLFYSVEYSIENKEFDKNKAIYGLVSLNRNSDSGISSAYFGLRKDQPFHYLHSMYLNNDWIYQLSSHKFELDEADIITDSLHSPLLINPDNILTLADKSRRIDQENINTNQTKWTFIREDKPDKVSMIYDQLEQRIMTLEYEYNYTSQHSYSRIWKFNYHSKSKFLSLTKGVKDQIASNDRAFL